MTSLFLCIIAIAAGTVGILWYLGSCTHKWATLRVTYTPPVSGAYYSCNDHLSFNRLSVLAGCTTFIFQCEKCSKLRTVRAIGEPDKVAIATRNGQVMLRTVK